MEGGGTGPPFLFLFHSAFGFFFSLVLLIWPFAMASSLVLPAKAFIISRFVSIEIGFHEIGSSGGSLPSPLAKADVERPLATMTPMRDLEAEHVAAKVRQLQP